jgi:hypothetical protein
MALCDPSGTSIAAGSGIVVSGSGTPGDPWLISATDPVDIVDIENDIANIQAILSTAASTYVNVTGDSMTGNLDFAPGCTVIMGGNPYSASVAIDGATFQPHLLTISSINTSAENIRLYRSEAANVVGQIYQTFCGGGSAGGSVYGSVTRTSGGVAYNTTSDRVLKENVETIDDESALLWMRMVEPVFFNFIGQPNIRQVGYIAQDVAEIWPNAVNNGVVTPGVPWMMDHGRITPFLHAGIQALDRTLSTHIVTVDDHESRIEDLEAAAGIGDDSRLDAMEASITALQATVVTQAAEIVDLQRTVADQAAQIAALEASPDDAITVAISDLRNEVYYTRQMTAAWQYSNTTGTPPTAGQLRSNTPLTNLYMNKVDTDGFNRSAALNYIVTSTLYKYDSARIRIRGANGSVFEVRSNGPAVDNGTWVNIPVTIVAGTEGSKGTRVEMTMLSEIWAEDPPLMATPLPSGPEPEATPK